MGVEGALKRSVLECTRDHQTRGEFLEPIIRVGTCNEGWVEEGTSGPPSQWYLGIFRSSCVPVYFFFSIYPGNLCMFIQVYSVLLQQVSNLFLLIYSSSLLLCTRTCPDTQKYTNKHTQTKPILPRPYHRGQVLQTST